MLDGRALNHQTSYGTVTPSGCAISTASRSRAQSFAWFAGGSSTRRLLWPTRFWVAGGSGGRHVPRSAGEKGRTGGGCTGLVEGIGQEGAQEGRAVSERERGASFGAIADGIRVADLGIVRCGTTARYQSVGTNERHRRRGLASHLLGVAARWAADRGCDQWVIVAEATNPAGRVYRTLGFEPDTGNAQAYRKPKR